MEGVSEKHNEKSEKVSQPMKVEEIVEFIQKLGFPKIDRSIVESNDSDIVVELFSSLFEKIGLIKKDKLKIKFEGMGLFSYTTLHDRPIYIFKLFNSIKKFVVDIIGFGDFSTSDLFSPIPKRTKKILSGLIKFYKYKQAEKETYSMMKENYENSKALHDEEKLKSEKVETNFLKIK